ncbi:hypothetical protein pb186bvf_009082 [Paramecium bursaria]
MGICQTKINQNYQQKASLQETMVATKNSPTNQQIQKTKSATIQTIQRQSIVSLKTKIIPKYRGSVFKQYSIFPKDSHINSIYRAFQVQHNLTGQFRMSLIIDKHCHNGMLFYKKLKKTYMDHPNICRIYEIYKDQNQYHIITEYCQGCPLGTFAMRTLTEEEIKRIMQQIIQAIIYLHSLQLKCKLTLQSFYFLNESDELILKFTDFLSIFGNQDITHEQVLYQSPEECQQEPKSNLASDIWSVGVIFFRLLSGYMPISKQKDIDRTRLSIRRANINFDSLDLEKRNKKGVKLMKHLLRIENKSRIYLIRALQDTYFQNGTHSRNSSFIQNALENIENQKKKANIVQLMIYQFMIKQFGSDMQQKLFDTFSAFDVNKDGKLSKQEVRQIYLTLFKELDPNDHVERIFKIADLDQSGDIDLSEFVLATFDKNFIINKKNLDLTFKLLDQNNSGKISIKELSDKLDIDYEKTSQVIVEFLKKLAGKQGKDKHHRNFFVLDDFKIFMFQII